MTNARLLLEELACPIADLEACHSRKLRYVGRTYGGDTIKVEPREMDRLPILNPVALATDERERLANLFDQLCRAGSQEAERTIRQAIDAAVAAITDTDE